MPSKRDSICREPATHSSAQAITKEIKQYPHSPPVRTTLCASKRKRSADEFTDDPALTLSTKKVKPTPHKVSASNKKPFAIASKGTRSKSTLVPRGTRKKATVGHKDESLLRMVCDCSTTNTVTELHFRNIPHSMIDWNSVHHISKINAWRNQIYGRGGLKARSVSLWYEQEELWFELYFQLSIVESRKRGLLLPATRQVRDAFNATLVGSVIQDKAGNDLPPRVERESNAFASKFNRVYPALRARLNSCLFGRSGDVYMPKITFKMMERYRAMKAEMAAKGIECESEYADHLDDWQHFLSHLPDSYDAEMQGVTTEEAEAKDMEAKEIDAVAALISLSHSTPNLQVALSPAVGGIRKDSLTAHVRTLTDPVAVSCNTDTANQHTTPELTRSTRTSFSEAIDSPYVPPQPPLHFQGRAYNPNGIYGCEHGNVHACEQAPIVSPSVEAREFGNK